MEERKSLCCLIILVRSLGVAARVDCFLKNASKVLSKC